MATDVETPMLQSTDHDPQPVGSSSGVSSRVEPADRHRSVSSASGGDEDAGNGLPARLEPQTTGRDRSGERSGPLEIATDAEKENKENDHNQREPADKSLKFTEAPPPKINPWTKKKNMVTANSVNVSSQETGLPAPPHCREGGQATCSQASAKAALTSC